MTFVTNLTYSVVIINFSALKNKRNVIPQKGGYPPPPFWVGREGGLLVIPHGFPPHWLALAPQFWLGGWAVFTTLTFAPPLKIMFSEYVVWRVIIFWGVQKF